MKKVPKAQPPITAIAVHNIVPPSEMPITPTASVARFASPENQTGHRSRTLP